jgi:glycosyltransferase involved in cell wall biosynthesis
MRVSVVIPWGRLEDDVLRAIMSAARQSQAPLEILVVPNREVTWAVAESRLADVASAVLVVPGSGPNANAARNLGVAAAQGDWVAFLDSDDWWDPEWLAEVSSRCDALGCAVDGFYGGIRVVNGAGEEQDVVRAYGLEPFGTAENYLLSYHSASTCTLVLRRQILRKCRWDESLRRHQDYDLFARLVRSGARLAHVDTVLVNVLWSGSTRHRAHADCLLVTSQWAGKVAPGYYYRHLKNLLIGAVRSLDPAALIIPFGFLNVRVLFWYVRRNRR